MEIRNPFDDAQLLAWVATFVGGIVTGFAFRDATKQRSLDLKWKKVDSANKLIAEIHNNKNAAAAIETLDWLHSRPSDKADVIDFGKVLQILTNASGFTESGNESHNYVRKLDNQSYDILSGFDWLFYYIDRMEQNIRDGFFDFDHVKYIFIPYFEKMNIHGDIFDKFAESRRYVLAPKFWARYRAVRFW
jgi:hypothetical protein